MEITNFFKIFVYFLKMANVLSFKIVEDFAIGSFESLKIVEILSKFCHFHIYFQNEIPEGPNEIFFEKIKNSTKYFEVFESHKRIFRRVNPKTQNLVKHHAIHYSTRYIFCYVKIFSSKI